MSSVVGNSKDRNFVGLFGSRSCTRCRNYRDSEEYMFVGFCGSRSCTRCRNYRPSSGTSVALPRHFDEVTGAVQRNSSHSDGVSGHQRRCRRSFVSSPRPSASVVTVTDLCPVGRRRPAVDRDRIGAVAATRSDAGTSVPWLRVLGLGSSR